MSDEKIPDWAAIEVDYRLGIKALRQIASEQGITEGAIRKRARKEDWERDLAAKVQSKADALVRKEAVRNSVRKAIPESEIINSNARDVADVQLNQRGDIQRARSLCNSLLAELEAQTANVPELEHLGEILRNPGDNGQDKLNDIYKAVISLPERTKTMKAWTESFRALIAMEREAYGIQATEQTKDLTVRLLPSDAGLL